MLQTPQRIGQVQRRLKLVGVKVSTSGGRCTAEVALEREGGRKIVCRSSDKATERGMAFAAANATAAALGEAIGGGPDAFDIVDIQKITVFDSAALVVAITARTKSGNVKLVGLGLISPDRPAHASVLAVLHATNRYVSAYLSGPKRKD